MEVRRAIVSLLLQKASFPPSAYTYRQEKSSVQQRKKNRTLSFRTVPLSLVYHHILTR